MQIDVTSPAAAEWLWVVADRIRFHGGLPGSDLELIEVEVPPGSGTPPHSHAAAEMFCVTEGALTITQFGGPGAPETVAAGPGTTVRIPGGVPHAYMNDSGAPARMFVLIEGSMIAFFREIGSPVRQAEPDVARIGAAMQRHGIAMAA